MQIPDEVLDLGLKPNEFYLLASLFRHADKSGVVDLTMEQLSGMVGMSRTTLWREMSKLEDKGLVDTHRTKRNLGKFWKNKYQLLSPCFISEHMGVDIDLNDALSCFKDETSTADSNITADLLVTTKVKNTTYSLGADAPKREGSMVSRWKDDDDDIAGVGLFASEAVPAGKKISKRDPKTRHQRPQEDWTAADVASEFAFRVYDKVRGIPGLVNTNALRGALSANRARFEMNATLEMELLERFFGDERNLQLIKGSPKKAHGIFLNFITTNVSRVVDDLQMTSEDKVENYIYASDGKRFDNSMPGRRDLKEYEEKLRRA
jgi:hypothetical protein